MTRTSNEGGSVEIFPFVDKTNVTITATDEGGKNTSEPKVVEVTPERRSVPSVQNDGDPGPLGWMVTMFPQIFWITMSQPLGQDQVLQWC